MQNSSFVKRFLEAADSWICDGYTIDIRYVAQRTKFGLVIIEAAVYLWPLSRENLPELDLSTPSLVAGRYQIFQASKLSVMEVIRNAVSGVIEVKGMGEAVKFIEGLDFDSEMLESDRWDMPLHLAVYSPETEYPHQLSMAEIDSELRRADPPFDGLSDLLGWLGFGFRKLEKKAPSIVLNVSPPVDLFFDNTSLSDGDLSIVLNAHQNLDVGLVRLAVMAFPGNGLDGRRQISNLIKWEDTSDNMITGRAFLHLDKCDSVMIVVGMNSDAVRRQMIVDHQRSRNQRFLAINRFDEGLKKLRQNLFEAQNSRDFELGVASLLFLLGFSAARPQETNSPDIIVSTPLGRIIIVECTTKLDDYSTKLGKLVQRRSLLSESLATAGLPGPAIAVLVCRLPRSSVLLKIDDFIDNDVIYFGAENIENALIQARYLLNADSMLDDALAAIRSASRVDSHEGGDY